MELASVVPFHYLITIHNKEPLLDAVLRGIEACAGRDAVVVPVLDGCTDGSERVVKEFAMRARVEVRPVFESDVHEIRAINTGLEHCGPGFCMVLQDDVVLDDPRLESRVRTLCEEQNHQLGVISFRMGGDIATESWGSLLRELWRSRGRRRARTLDIVNLVGSPFDTHDVSKTRVLAPGEFVELPAVYKSPVCFTPELRALEPRLDDTLAPYAYDDLDLSVRALRRGLRNGLLALPYASEKDWGSTRQENSSFKRDAGRIVMRNRYHLWQKHRDFFRGSGARWLRYH